MTATFRALFFSLLLGTASLLGACAPGAQTSLNTEVRGSDVTITRAAERHGQNPSRAW